MRLDALLRKAALRLAPWRGGPALLVRPRIRALRGVLGVLLLRRRLPGALAALDAGAPADHPAGDASTSRQVVEVLSRLPTSCLWRALAGYAALRDRGEPVRFVLGVGTAGGDLVAHAWLERDGIPLAQPDDPRARFAVAFMHPGPDPGPIQEPSMPDPAGRPDVILTELQDGTGVLLHLGTKFYYALNCTGVAVWKLLQSGVSDPDALARDVAARFEGATEAQARADVLALLAELRAEGLAPEPG